MNPLANDIQNLILVKISVGDKAKEVNVLAIQNSGSKWGRDLNHQEQIE
jgi:hypothetical protein